MIPKNEKWSVDTGDGDGCGVDIVPPNSIDKDFDDLRLRISGNLSKDDAIIAANVICDVLNYASDVNSILKLQNEIVELNNRWIETLSKIDKTP